MNKSSGDEWSKMRRQEMAMSGGVLLKLQAMVQLADTANHWATYPGGGYDTKGRYEKMLQIRKHAEALLVDIDAALEAQDWLADYYEAQP